MKKSNEHGTELLRCRIKDHTLNNQEEKDESGNEYAKSKIRNRCGEQRLFSGEPFRNEKRKSGESYKEKYPAEDIYECPICIVESEIHMVQALEDLKKAGCNALCVYLGNFGPEISETLLAKHFDGPKMFVAAAEEDRGSSLPGKEGMLIVEC